MSSFNQQTVHAIVHGQLIKIFFLFRCCVDRLLLSLQVVCLADAKQDLTSNESMRVARFICFNKTTGSQVVCCQLSAAGL